jgi:outer membrane biosynthesis protein TonB
MSTSPSPSPNPLQKPERFDLYSRKFAAICEMHSIKTGSREDLEGFLDKLESNRHFAMDFWGLAGKLSAREGGELSDEHMLALVVEGVTGKPLPNESDAALDPTLSLLRAMVAGVDVQRPAPTPSIPVRTAPVEPIDEARSRLASTEEQRKRFSAGLASMPQPAEPEPIPAPLPSQLQLALQSLELVSRDLGSHLHKIDQRLSGLEVKVKKQAARVDLPVSTVRDTTLKPPARPQLSLHPAVLATTEERRIYETAPSGRDTNWRKNVRLAVVFLSGLAVIFCLNYYSPIIRQKFHAIVQEDLETPAGSIWDRDTRPPALLPPSTRSATVATPPQLPQSVSSPPPEASKLASVPKDAPDHALERNERASINSAGAIRVAAAEMERRLIASRVPIYPEEARIERVEGTVVAQALISKFGAVTRVHVISGDPRLLSAATEAMYQRHYRPYLLNGTPVEVSTIIAVNFKLNG